MFLKPRYLVMEQWDQIYPQEIREPKDLLVPLKMM